VTTLLAWHCGVAPAPAPEEGISNTTAENGGAVGAAGALLHTNRSISRLFSPRGGDAGAALHHWSEACGRRFGQRRSASKRQRGRAVAWETASSSVSADASAPWGGGGGLRTERFSGGCLDGRERRLGAREGALQAVGLGPKRFVI